MGITYGELGAVDPRAMLEILNDARVRRHLVPHPLFTPESIGVWVEGKLAIDARERCHVRAVYSSGELAGWCGVQDDQGVYDLGIVLSPLHWGLGRPVFAYLLDRCRVLGHREVRVLLPESRRGQRAMEKRLGRFVGSREIAGCSFREYSVLTVAAA